MEHRHAGVEICQLVSQVALCVAHMGTCSNRFNHRKTFKPYIAALASWFCHNRRPQLFCTHESATPGPCVGPLRRTQDGEIRCPSPVRGSLLWAFGKPTCGPSANRLRPAQVFSHMPNTFHSRLAVVARGQAVSCADESIALHLYLLNACRLVSSDFWILNWTAFRRPSQQ